MKLTNSTKRYLTLGVASIALITVFQNCGQPGSITQSSQEITDVDDRDIKNPPPPDNPPGYQSFEKSITVNPPVSKVDVLVVVDNSGSMQLEQANMATRFNNFLGRLQGLDWQLGITTTDVRTENNDAYRKDGRLLKFDRFQRHIIRSSDDPNLAAQAFSETIQRPPQEGSGNEQGVKATFRAFERAASDTGPNVGLIRADAALSVILVSDADETVAGNDKAGDISTFGEKNMPENLKQYVTTNYPNKIFKFNSIIVRDGDLACLNLANSENEGYGKNYHKISGLTSGIVGSVCEADYSNQLTVIGDNTAETVRTVTLDCAPVDSDTNGALDFSVTPPVGGKVPSYKVNGRVVEFAEYLSPGDYKFNFTCLK